MPTSTKQPLVSKKITKQQPSTPTSSSSLTLSKVTLLLSGLFALAVVLLPIIFSEFAGGWTKKYTSPSPIFTPSRIGNLTGQVAIVTGSNTGIGYYTALELARHGATVVVAARSATKGEAAVAKIQQDLSTAATAATVAITTTTTTTENVRFLPLDLSSLESVRSFARQFLELGLPLHKLILNAGIMKSPGQMFIGKEMSYGYDVTKDGFESHVGVNHIGHYYLTQLLREVLVQSAPSRVVSVSSMAEEGAYPEEGIRFDTWKAASDSNSIPDGYEDGIAYGQSKLANILFAQELAEQLNGTSVTAYSCHPGIIMTELSRYMVEEQDKELKTVGWLQKQMVYLFGKYFEKMQFTAPDGALTQLHLAVADPSTLQSGGFYHPIGSLMGGGRHPQGTNSTLAKLVWTETGRMIQEAGF